MRHRILDEHLPHLGRSCVRYLSRTLSLLHNQEHADLSESRITTQPTGQLLMRLPISVGHNSPASLILSPPFLTSSDCDDRRSPSRSILLPRSLVVLPTWTYATRT